MPIGKQSINRVAKKADIEEVKPVVAEQPVKEQKPATAKKSTSCKTAAKTPKKEAVAAPAKETVAKPVAPTVTEHVIANIDPAVVEAVVGKPTTAPKDGKTAIYAVSLGLDGFHGISPTGTGVIQSYMPDLSAPGAVKTGEVELVAGVALKNTLKAAVLHGIAIA